LTPQQSSLVQQYEKSFRKQGYEVKYLDCSWWLTGVPHVLNIVLGEADFEDVLAKLPCVELPVAQRLQQFYASKACRSAVMIGDSLTMEKMGDIVRKMSELEKPWNCPHGRPTIRLLTVLEMVEE
jgi:DNA mismatch repair protein PMS2